MIINKAFKYRIYPSEQQRKLLAHTFGCKRFVYNSLLDWRTKEYAIHQNKINYSKTSAKLTELKTEYTFLKDVSSVALQQCLRDQDVAFTNFFKKRAKYPTFKKKHNKQSIRLVGSAFSIRDNHLYIAKSKEPIDVRWSRPLEGDASSITISKDSSDRYFVSILCEVQAAPMPKKTNAIGLDLGLTTFVTTSNGDKYDPLKAYKKYEAKLAILQRKMSRKKKGSNNRNKARLKVAQCHAKITDCRKDYLHKLSTKLINENQVLSVEDLDIVSMLKDEYLAKGISDAGWGEFITQLRYKADWYGRDLVGINQWYPSSQICSACGAISGKKALHIRKWKCSCGANHDRDVNAAININRAGQAQIAECNSANACGDRE